MRNLINKLRGVENANALCYTCGTTKQTPENCYCINGHDNWIQKEDEDLITMFSLKHKIPEDKVLNHIITNKDFKLKTSEPVKL